MASKSTDIIEVDVNGGIRNEQLAFLRKVFANAHVNILIGSAFSLEVIPTLGHRESWFQEVDERLRDRSSSNWNIVRSLLRLEYFRSVMWPLYDASPTPEQNNFLSAARRLISDRGTTLLPKRLNVFTTNYDPLIEVALEELGIPFNDGFAGRMSPRFDSSSFSRLMCEQSLFMEYTSQVTTANVLKLHGSLTWRRNDDGAITYSAFKDLLASCLDGCDGALELPVAGNVNELIVKPCDEDGISTLEKMASNLPEGEKELIRAFGRNYDSTMCIVNPAKKKFEETVLEQSYYDLLRIFANELDRNNALLLVFGFSFADEHIRELTKRAARSNPKLLIIISCYHREAAESYRAFFPDMDNVFYLVPKENGVIGLNELTEVIRCATS